MKVLARLKIDHNRRVQWLETAITGAGIYVETVANLFLAVTLMDVTEDVQFQGQSGDPFSQVVATWSYYASR